MCGAHWAPARTEAGQTSHSSCQSFLGDCCRDPVNDAVIGGDLVLGLLGVENLQKVPVRRFGATRGSLWCDLFSRHCEAGTKLSKGRGCPTPNSPLFLGGSGENLIP